MNIRHFAAIGLAALAVSQVSAQAKPEQQIEYRQSVMTVMARSVGALSAMAKGNVPFDKGVAARHAAVLANLSELPFAAGAFGPGTDKGADTKADPKVWSEPEKFKSAADKLVAATRALPAAAGSVETLKTALADLGKTCKGCHDSYRMK